jgi:FkbM family methyltransferase
MSLFIPVLKKNGLLENIHMTICNVGSRKVDSQDDYANQGWEIFAPNLSIYGFDADVDACDEANIDLELRQINWNEKHIPLALGKEIETRTLYVTKQPFCSSLYPPNDLYIKRLGGLSELMALDFSLEVTTTTLDRFCEEENISEVDFLQIDVQGADLDVLQGSLRALNSSTLAVQIEVEFSSLYTKQPLFADVDTFLRKYDFSLFDIAPSYRLREGLPISSDKRLGQLLWGDAFYLRDLLREDINVSEQLKSPGKMLKLACIADIMSFTDYSLEILVHLTRHNGEDPRYNFANSIIETLAQFSYLVDHGLETLPVVQQIQDYASNLHLYTNTK